MKSSVTAFAIMILQVIPIHVNAQEPWRFISDNVLIGDGTSNHSDHLEIIASQDCDTFELRIWARIFDIDTNLLGFDDTVKLTLTVGDDLVASKASVLHMATDLTTNFDLVYLSVGSWDWKTLQMVSLSEADMFSAVFDDERANVEDNIWQIANLPHTLTKLRQNCFSQSAGGFMEARKVKSHTLYGGYA
jgi:hypothetical protein